MRSDRTAAVLDRRWRQLVLGLWGLAPVMLGVGLLRGAGGTEGLWAAVGSRRVTPRGAAELNSWFAFKQYLLNVPPQDLREVGRRFDEYLPYALALFADTLLIEQLRRGRVPVRVPGWYAPAARPPADTGGAMAPGRRRKRRNKPDFDATDDLDFDVKPGGRDNESAAGGRGLAGGVEDLNRGLVASVESVNRGLAGLISATTTAFAGSTLAGDGGDSSSSGWATGSSDSGGFSFSGAFTGSSDSGGFSSDSGSSSSSNSGGGGGGSSDTF